MEFVYPILIFVVMGIVFGVLLVVISKVFAVETDERAVKITEALPGANCGACGYAGCADYADAIVNKGAPMNACLPGGANAAAAIGEIMGVFGVCIRADDPGAALQRQLRRHQPEVHL